MAAAASSRRAHLTVYSRLQVARWRHGLLLLHFSVLPAPTPGRHPLHCWRTRCLPGLLPLGTASLLLIILVLLLLADSSVPLVLILILVLILHEGQALLQGWAVLGPLPLLRGLPRLLPPARHKLLLLLLHQRQPAAAGAGGPAVGAGL